MLCVGLFNFFMSKKRYFIMPSVKDDILYRWVDNKERTVFLFFKNSKNSPSYTSEFTLHELENSNLFKEVTEEELALLI